MPNAVKMQNLSTVNKDGLSFYVALIIMHWAITLWRSRLLVQPNKQYDEEDLKLMASYGVNCIRLLFSWSKLEPVRGQYNQEYISQLKTVIEATAKYNIYVMLDMHQDAFSKFIFSTADENCQNPLNGWTAHRIGQ